MEIQTQRDAVPDNVVLLYARYDLHLSAVHEPIKLVHTVYASRDVY